MPVIVSGGLSSDERSLAALDQSGAEAVMLARGSLGEPMALARLLGGHEGEPSPAQAAAELEWVIERAEQHLGTELAALNRRSPHRRPT